MLKLFVLSLIPVICQLCAGFEYFLSNISGKVSKDKFAYHSATDEGTILVELTSLSGDCDLYVSQITQKPSYEPEANCLSSITCGLDSVIIPKSFKRPIGIGIFGHPSHDACSYNLAFYRIEDSRDIFNFDPYETPLRTEVNKELQNQSVESSVPDSEKKSFSWVFLRDTVLFLIEIIL